MSKKKILIIVSSDYEKMIQRRKKFKIQNNNEKHFEQDVESGIFCFLMIFLR